MSYEMVRGVSQSLYKYLPDSWIDFSPRSDKRNTYKAYVVRWNSEKLVNINKPRLLRLINRSLDSFKISSQNDPRSVQGFSAGLNPDDCEVLTPKHNCDERGALARISPLAFFCSRCHKVYQFDNSISYYNNTACRVCGVELTQMSFVYSCTCGYATDKYNIVCNRCRSSANITWSGRYNDFKFRCTRCGNIIDMVKRCEWCQNEYIKPKGAFDNSHFFPFSLNLVDIIDEKTEQFISGTDYGTIMTISWWLGSITRDNLSDIIKNGISTDPEEYQRSFDNFLNLFRASGLDEESAQTAAGAAAANQCGSNYLQIADETRSELFASAENLPLICESLLEFLFVKEQKDVSTLDDAARVSEMLNTNANPEGYNQIAERYGIASVVVCGNLPYVTCSYGYTRQKSEPGEGVVLRAFREERHGVKNVYAAKLNTEGVMFELDRAKIIRWLDRNGYVERENLPVDGTDAQIKLWFVNNVKPALIEPFSEISEKEKATYYVYRLIHTISHLLVKSAAATCGLDKNSISEYILPGVPAVLIYCQNSQGFNLGALFNIFEAYFDKWISGAAAAAEKCIFDPVCFERYKACTGCLYLNEISCQHFNHDLDRSLITGYIDRATKKRYYGFWEMQ